MNTTKIPVSYEMIRDTLGISEEIVTVSADHTKKLAYIFVKTNTGEPTESIRMEVNCAD